MPEAEEVITDAARHATIYARALWQRHRGPPGETTITLRDVAQRLDLLVTAALGKNYPIQVAQPPAPATFLTKLFRRGEGPRVQYALPATDGTSIWLPGHLPGIRNEQVVAWYRVIALQQAARAARGSAAVLVTLETPLQQAIYAALEAYATDQALAEQLPGTWRAIEDIRATILQQRPSIGSLPAYRQPLEEIVQALMRGEARHAVPSSPVSSAALAKHLASEMATHTPRMQGKREFLFRDWWTGDLYAPAGATGQERREPPATGVSADPVRPRSARLSRRPKVRDADDDEDDGKQGAWMVQTSQPHEQAEDPIGMQRPTDRDETTAAEEFADSLSELAEARLVATPGRPREVLLSDDTPIPKAKRTMDVSGTAESTLQYPEWDYRLRAYREHGATVHLSTSGEGSQDWVDRTLREYQSMLNMVRRRFEMLRAQRVTSRKQLEGDEIDLQAYVDGYSDFRAGAPMNQALYQAHRPAKRDMAIMLLIDISGSTDAWISAEKRVIDVEKQALLLVSIALQGLAEPYAIAAFSGEGPHGVAVRGIKSFDEVHGNDVARRIASLEPEHYTRAGAAIRHATTALMRRPARHRLLLLLSDGKPNDVDEYEGQYGVEDMRQAIAEAKLQGVHPFCLTIDRQAAGYLPLVFGVHQYAMLPRPDLLPTVLLEWMKRLVAA